MNSEKKYYTSGGFADIFVSKNENGMVQADKKLQKRFINNDIAINIFQREIRLLNSLEHDFVPRILWSNTIGDCFTYNFFSGRNLTQSINMDVNKAILRNIIRSEISNILSYIHSKGIIHGDLVPENIIVSDSLKSVSLIDFGCAYTRSEGSLPYQIARRPWFKNIMDEKNTKPEYIDYAALDYILDNILH